jgi:hypothetical protein
VLVTTTDMFDANSVNHLGETHARALAFAEMDRARTSRVAELLDPPGLRDAVVEADPAGVVLAGAPDIWTPTTAPLPALLPAPVPTGSAPSTE